MADIQHFAFKATPVPGKLTMRVGLTVGMGTIDIEIPTIDASTIASIALGAARVAYDQSGKPPPHSSKDEPITLAAVSPSGCSVGPGRKPEKVMLIFHFGDAAIGMEIPKEVGQTLSQQLLLLLSNAGTPQ